MIALRVGLLLSVTLGLAAGCKEERTPLGPPPPCKAGEMCGTVAVAGGTGSGGAGGDGGQGGAATTGDLGGTIEVLNSSTFNTTDPYTGSATVLALLDNETVTEPYDGATPFLFEGLPTGDLWLLATPEQSSTLLPVFTVHTVPSSNVVAPILDVDVLTDIAIGLAGQPLPQSGAAQIILKVERSGLPLAGVSVIGDTGDAVVAYDAGGGAFSADTLATDTAGIVLLLNAFGPGDVEFTTLTLQDEALTEYDIEVPITADAVTFATFELL